MYHKYSISKFFKPTFGGEIYSIESRVVFSNFKIYFVSILNWNFFSFLIGKVVVVSVYFLHIGTIRRRFVWLLLLLDYSFDCFHFALSLSLSLASCTFFVLHLCVQHRQTKNHIYFYFRMKEKDVEKKRETHAHVHTRARAGIQCMS